MMGTSRIFGRKSDSSVPLDLKPHYWYTVMFNLAKVLAHQGQKADAEQHRLEIVQNAEKHLIYLDQKKKLTQQEQSMTAFLRDEVLPRTTSVLVMTQESF